MLSLALLIAAAAVPTVLPAQEVPATPSSIAGFGPLDPAQPTGITVADIVTRMGQRESAFEHARDRYTFRQQVKMDTISDDTGKPDGEWQEVTDITYDNAGHRLEHVAFAPGNTIERVIINQNDVNDIKERLPFVLTTAQLPEYNVTYVGQQKVDDLETYVFDVAPKQIVKGHRYLQGKIWADKQDFQIVLVNGINVPQDTRRGHEDLSPPFTTYYQQIDGKYWFPTYTRAEGVLHFPGAEGSLAQDVHMRATVRYTDYKQYHTSVTIEYAGQKVESEPDAARDNKPATTSTQTPTQPHP